ncbi:unnamed protein product [Schistosoma curassoni]|uniref:Endo/exonuclease/phosphatase domain-containing protein n=1 Tax=Schistosoma curassoni TaxID=6186 RepID=A0A183KNB4_9TREM|nr:unnamed protein product [Schistosoma curassoni]
MTLNCVRKRRFDFQGYMSVKNDRNQKRKGGVARFIRRAIPFIVIDKLSHESGTCEIIRCRLKYKGQDLLVGLDYRRSSCGVNRVLLDGFNNWSQRDRRQILRDFDAPTVDWKNMRTKLSDNSLEQELADAVITCALVRHLGEETTYDPDSELSSLDLTLTYYQVMTQTPTTCHAQVKVFMKLRSLTFIWLLKLRTQQPNPNLTSVKQVLKIICTQNPQQICQ